MLKIQGVGKVVLAWDLGGFYHKRHFGLEYKEQKNCNSLHIHLFS